MRISTSPPKAPLTLLSQWATWIALSSLGIALGFLISWAVDPALSSRGVAPEVFRLASFVLLPGFTLGAVQWLFLRSLDGFALWAPLTAATFPFIAWGLLGAGFAAGEPGPPLEQIAGLAMGAAIFCTPTAFAQWLLLRQRFHRAALWILASDVGWFLAFCFLVYGPIAAYPPTDLGVPLVAGSVVAIQSAVTGFILLSLTPKVPQPPMGT
jgi:hypothetical protein